MSLSRYIRRRKQEWRERIALTAVIAFLLVGMAYITHADKPQVASSGTADEICGFCLHFAHIGSAPATEIHVARSLPDAGPILPPQAAPPAAPVLAYFSRGPPA